MPQKTEDADWTYFKKFLAKTAEGQMYNGAWIQLLNTQKILFEVLNNRDLRRTYNLANARSDYIRDLNVADECLKRLEIKYSWPRY